MRSVRPQPGMMSGPCPALLILRPQQAQRDERKEMEANTTKSCMQRTKYTRNGPPHAGTASISRTGGRKEKRFCRSRNSRIGEIPEHSCTQLTRVEDVSGAAVSYRSVHVNNARLAQAICKSSKQHCCSPVRHRRSPCILIGLPA
jgi:hypothetical protein